MSSTTSSLKTAMADKLLEILRTTWGYPDFRGIQRDIIESVACGRDTLGLMPTGGGKSITFQVPALAAEGVCLVVTPLIALMKDQVQHLRDKGILADAVYSGMSRSEILRVLENCILGHTKFLYVSPERLGTELFLQKLRRMKLSLITIDEAHCISQWGYDFRPSYLEIAKVRQLKPGVPVLALTATATPEVVDDIQERLEFREKNVFKMSFERKNLAYIVRQTADKQGEMIHILESVPGTAIVYARSRKRTKELADLLNKANIPATFYHAGLETAVKDERQKAWQADEVRVMVATNAFGMGIDKPDVRMVIHYDCPDSIEAYFQEAGRGGRDGEKAYAVLLYNNNEEVKLRRRIEDTYPEKDFIRDVYDHLAYFFQVAIESGCGKSFEFDIDRFCFIYKYFPTRVDAALHILEHCGYLHYEEHPDSKPAVRFHTSRSDLYLLESLTAMEDKVITSLLRLYGGLFTDYVYIDESLVAMHCGLERQQVYMVLKNLRARHIIDFIPQRQIPFVTYTRQRYDGSSIVITREAWEERKAQFEKRIGSMLLYCKDDNVCRSRQLLRYFGEESSEDCGQCDVCIAHKRQARADRSQMEQACQAILDLLADSKPHHIRDLHSLHLPTKQLDNAVAWLVSEDRLSMDGLMVQGKNS